MSRFAVSEEIPSHHLAVIGMAGRFPGAASVEELWRLLLEGREAIRRFGPEELEDPSVLPEELTSGLYVPARGLLAGADLFDAAFFGYAAREAEVLDPQQRIFLECAYEALESAGYDPFTLRGLTGVYAGVGMSTYAALYLLSNAELVRQVGAYQLLLSNDKDFLATNVSYRLNLKGPSVTVQTACSTSLVAVHFAALSLASYDCDLALAGGVSIQFPARLGYRYEEGGILAKDGHCRPFDREATGMVGGSGAGVVVLKRLADALADGDPIRAVVRGTAVNNDGHGKVGFTAPSAAGQAEVIAAAQAVAGVSPASITFVEAHGTATPLGDPIEVEALKRVWSAASGAPAMETVLGSLKSNLGHLDAAAGVAGLIKTVLALEHGTIPPTLHFRAPNPRLGLEGSPFVVNTTLRAWPRTGTEPRRAGVSSFGIGGTNAHAVLEEAPALEASGPGRPVHLLLLSARSEAALAARAAALADHLEKAPGLCLADVAYTLAAGRHGFSHRLALLGGERGELLAALRGTRPELCLAGVAGTRGRPVAFLLPGQGTASAAMGRDLIHAEPVFRAALERAAQILAPALGLDLLRLLDPLPAERAAASEHLTDTRFAQPAIAAVSFALAELLASWGIRPAALLGHSLGEYVAASLAGVFDLEAALRLVAERGRLMSTLPAGAMLAVPLPASELLPLLGEELELAAENGPSLSTVAGPPEVVAAFAQTLAARGISCRRLATRHAFHSRALDAIREPFGALLAKVEFHPPTLPYISNLTGTWVRADEATDPAMWLSQLRAPVRFAAGLTALAENPAAPGAVLLEVGPGRSLSALVAQQGWPAPPLAVATLPTAREGGEGGLRSLYRALGALWLAGVEVDHAGFYAQEARRRLVLPTYPFERQRYWVGAAPEARDQPAAAPSLPAKHARRASLVPYAPPHPGLEEQIAAAWGELLGLDAVGRHDDFFELGGHSLAALRLAAELSSRLGVRLTAAAITEAPTVAALARELARVEAGGPSRPLVRLAEGDGERPFFAVHPIGGGIFAYRELARRLSHLGPVYGLEAPSFAGAEAPARRIEPLAARYLEALRAAQGSGPYRLGGWSFGGLVACAMAARLEAAGEEVELLTLIDSWPACDLPEPDAGELARLLERDLAAVPAGVGAGERARLCAHLEAHAEAAHAFRPRSLACPALLVLAAGEGTVPAAVRRLWQPYLSGPVRERRLAADHYSLLTEPAVGILAAEIAEAIEWAHLQEDYPCRPAMT